MERIHEITEKFPTYFYYTITAYGKDVNFSELIPLSTENKEEIARGVGRTASEKGFILQTCGSDYALHDPDSPLLIGRLKPTDRLEEGSQKTFLKKGEKRNEIKADCL